MTVDFTLANLSRGAGIRTTGTTVGASQAASQTGFTAGQRADLFSLRDELVVLYQRIEALAELSDVRLQIGTRRTGSSSVTSSSSLGLDLSTSPTTLLSTAELNTVSLGYDPEPPVWQGPSSTTLNVFGSYNGSQGTDTLTFTAQNAGIRGFTNLILRISDGANNTLANITVNTTDPDTTRYAIGNGLEFSVGNGTQLINDTATLDVFDNLDNSIYANQPFSGSGSSGANFDPTNAAIADGSFTINGEIIAVSADDTLNAVLARINASNAGVTAVFDSGSERVELTQDTDGSQPDIVVGADNSNLVEALRLTAATSVAGRDSDASAALDTLARFSGVSAGDVSINSTAVSVDPATDTLDSLVAALDAADAGVDVSFQSLTQRLRIASSDPSATLTLDDADTNLLTALNLEAGVFDAAVEETNGFSRRRSYEFADAVVLVAESINTIFNSAGTTSNIAQTRTALGAGLGASLSADQGLFGLSRNQEGGDTLLIDRRALTRSLQNNGSDALKFFAGGNSAGLVERLEQAVRSSLGAVSEQLGVSSGLVDIVA